MLNNKHKTKQIKKEKNKYKHQQNRRIKNINKTLIVDHNETIQGCLLKSFAAVKIDIFKQYFFPIFPIMFLLKGVNTFVKK